MIEAEPQNRRKPVGKLIGQSGPIEEDAPAHLEMIPDRPCHHITRRELELWVDTLHNAAAALVNQQGPFASQGFGEERRGIRVDVEGGWMELNELETRQRGTGPGSHGESIAGRFGRVGGG